MPAARLIAAAVVMACAASCGRPEPGIVAGSAHIADILGALSTDNAGQTVRSLIPPGMCPGHFDMKPSDIRMLTDSRIVLLHPWQRTMANIDEVIRAAAIPDERIRVIPVEGNWMVPAVRVQAIDAIARVMSEAEPARADDYAGAAARQTAAVREFEQAIKKQLEELEPGARKILCNEMQRQFLDWAGFDVVAVYGRPEDLSVADVERLVATAREAGAALIVDNLQSGDTQLSEAIARDAGLVQVVLTNFPGGFENTDTWELAVRANVQLLSEAAGDWAQRHE
ncbi:MAG: zinc ABC transporter substrate-binding protein [Candidatus Hydrogenedentes bacterium]|nr:zinc ABC transporter substrate-binding protein [Candidatus Hydrogenedentota bacterium]